MLCFGPNSFPTIIYILSFYLSCQQTHWLFLPLQSRSLLLSLSPAASISGLRGLAQTQSWLLHKRVSGGRGAAGKGGEDTESQATGKNGLIRAAQHMRPQSNTTVVLYSSLFQWLSLSHHPSLPLCSCVNFVYFLSCSLLSLLPINCPKTVPEEHSGSHGALVQNLLENGQYWCISWLHEYSCHHPLMFSCVSLMQQQITLSLILLKAL